MDWAGGAWLVPSNANERDDLKGRGVDHVYAEKVRRFSFTRSSHSVV